MAIQHSLQTAIFGAGLVLLLGTGAALARTGAPLGFQILCLTTPAACAEGGAPMVSATPDVLALLGQVNSRVNRMIRPKADGRVDVWTISTNAGDCEDYVLAKRMALIAAGMPPAALRIATVQTRRGEGHAVLIVRTSAGDIVLDNLDPRLRGREQLGYRIVAMMSADPLVWN